MRSGKIIPVTAAGAAAALVAVLAIAPSVGAQGARAAARCIPVPNIEAIIDDSGSMSFTDPNRLRVAALDLLIETPGNEKITFGSVEFGGAFQAGEVSADTVFPPELIGPNAKSMESCARPGDPGQQRPDRLQRGVRQGEGRRPRSQGVDLPHGRRPRRGDIRKRPPRRPADVRDQLRGGILPEDGARLQQIANDNGGAYFPQTDSSNLQAVVNQIGTKLTCQTVPATFKDAFTKAGQSKTHSVPLAGNVKSAQLTLSWASPLDAFTFSGLKIVRKGKTVAVSSRKFKVTNPSRQDVPGRKAVGLVRGTLALQRPLDDGRIRRREGEPDHAGDADAESPLRSAEMSEPGCSARAPRPPGARSSRRPSGGTQRNRCRRTWRACAVDRSSAQHAQRGGDTEVSTAAASELGLPLPHCVA